MDLCIQADYIELGVEICNEQLMRQSHMTQIHMTYRCPNMGTSDRGYILLTIVQPQQMDKCYGGTWNIVVLNSSCQKDLVARTEHKYKEGH